MKVLIIGGTGFLGSYLVNVAQARNHHVTLLNRGQSNPNLFPQIETIFGDRERDLDKLSNRQWDAVNEPCQFIDVRDISEWIIHMLEAKATGRYNACGPDDSYTFGQLLDTCKEVSGSDARFRWASADFLEKHDVAAWRDFPIWFSPDWGIDPARFSIAKARGAELTFRPVSETVRATPEWVKTLPANYQWQVGLSADREARILAEL